MIFIQTDATVNKTNITASKGDRTSLKSKNVTVKNKCLDDENTYLIGNIKEYFEYRATKPHPLNLTELIAEETAYEQIPSEHENFKMSNSNIARLSIGRIIRNRHETIKKMFKTDNVQPISVTTPSECGLFHFLTL